MSKNKKRTAALSAALLLVAAGLVVAVRLQRRSVETSSPAEAVNMGPYRLIASESQVSVKMFGQKAGWLTGTFPVESAMVSGSPDSVNVTTALRWSRAVFQPEQYQSTFLEMFRPGHLVENRFEFLLKQVPIPAAGAVTDAAVTAHVMLYGHQKERTVDVVVTHVGEKVKLSTKNLVTMDLEDFQAQKLPNMLAVQSGASVSSLIEVRFNLVFEPNLSTSAP